MIDDINYQLYRQYFSMLNKKHYSLFILLKDILLYENAVKKINNSDEVYSSTAAREMYIRRNNAILKLKKHRINVLDLLPKQLTPGLINKYLEIKARNLI
jgi:uncharacterized protein (DUF58 family)